MKRAKLLLPGWALLFLIATSCTFLSQLVVLGGKHPIEASALAILVGIAVRNFNWLPSICLAGIESAEKFLALGIVLMGAGLNFHLVASQGLSILTIIIVTMLIGFFLIYFLGKILSLPKALSLLLAIGTTICGTTAIAIIAPIMKAPKEETSYAVATVALFGLLAVLLYPALGHYFHASDMEFGIFAGTAIHSTPQVVGAGFIFSDVAGQTATAIKLVRNCFIAPIALVIAFAYSGHGVSVVKVFPWFLFGYFIVAWATTQGFLNADFIHHTNESGKFLILIGMTGIGLNTSLSAFSNVGFKPLIVGAVGSIIVAVTSIFLIKTI